MDFGPWVRAQRGKLGVDIKGFARQVGVDASTISRIENRHTEASLHTAISILLASSVTPPQLVAEMNEQEPRLKEEIVRVGNQADVLSEEDIDSVRNLYRVDQLTAQAFLADLFNKILTHPGPFDGAKAPDDPRAAHESEGGKQSRFTVVEVRRFLADSPLYDCTVKYPADTDYREILRSYESGGILIHKDVAFFVRMLRRRRTTRGFLLAASVRSWAVHLERLELGLTDRVSLADVLAMDERLAGAEQPTRHSMLLGMFWRTAQYSAELGVARLTARGSVAEEQRWSEAEHRLVNVTVTLCRWLQYLNRQDSSWLTTLRHDISIQLAKAGKSDLASLNDDSDRGAGK